MRPGVSSTVPSKTRVYELKTGVCGSEVCNLENYNLISVKTKRILLAQYDAFNSFRWLDSSVGSFLGCLYMMSGLSIPDSRFIWTGCHLEADYSNTNHSKTSAGVRILVMTVLKVIHPSWCRS